MIIHDGCVASDLGTAPFQVVDTQVFVLEHIGQIPCQLYLAKTHHKGLFPELESVKHVRIACSIRAPVLVQIQGHNN